MHSQTGYNGTTFQGNDSAGKNRLSHNADLEKEMALTEEIKVKKLAAPKMKNLTIRHAADPVKKKARLERKTAAVETDE
jgi:hypothetical protein